ncbi:hypothetical protein RRG08_007169 [Elysia crispata]|uniref:PiggyBac transposable element-derived protein domain-containing protein n=1 Tax=Elysia crispata TaxID=231223 RepID=A0AAE1AQD2_9GAST|nr:hypothetical protein RRG08_007169 [Elysia crispata]
MPLLKYLISKNFHYTGTVDIGRKDFPADIKTLKLNFLEIKWYATESNSAYSSLHLGIRKQRKNVVVATTDGDGSMRQIQRRREIILKPSRVDEYNQHMNGCDRTDQQIQFYGLQKRKSNKWWKKIVHFFIEIAVVNASIIYNKTQPLVDGVRRKVPLAAFKNNLI